MRVSAEGVTACNDWNPPPVVSMDTHLAEQHTELSQRSTNFGAALKMRF